MRKSRYITICLCFLLLQFEKASTVEADRYLLPDSHPVKITLDSIIDSPDIFSNYQTIIQRGFIDKNSSGLKQDWCIHVVTHPLIEGYLIKTYDINEDDDHYKNALPRYIRRIVNAETIRNYIIKNHCQYLTVPKKWLYKIPNSESNQKSPNGKFLLIVEDMYILSGCFGHGDNGYLYFHMPEKHMCELLAMLYTLKGCDAWPQNIPFTIDDKLAFVDTDHLGRTFGDVHERIIPYFRSNLQETAKEFWSLLKKGLCQVDRYEDFR